jgi:xylulokinase
VTRAERYALAVDLGSGALKVGVVSLDGTVVAAAQAPLVTQRAPDGTAIQDAARWWALVRELSAQVLEAVPRDRVAAVACTGQWASTIPVDAAGEPVGPCLMWQDTRGAEHARRVVGGPLAGYSPRALAMWIWRTAGVPSHDGGDPVSHILHLERDEPQVAAAARWYLEPVDYLSMCFTGVAAASHASMTGAWLTDNRRLERLAYDATLIRRVGIDGGKLPPLVATGAVVGPVRAEVAAELGLASDVQVVTGSPDLHSAALGTGAADVGQAHLTISTTSWISLPVAKKKTDVMHSICTVPGLDPGSYLIVNNQEAAGLCLNWLREALPGDRDHEEVLALAAAAPPGSNGALFTPWLAGERSPVDDRDARGGWHNLSVETGAAELARSVLEGVALNSRWLLGAVERFVGHRLEVLRIFGGGAASDLWCQIYADALDRTIERVADPVNTNLRGATLLAALALGAVRRDELRELVPVERTFTSDPATRTVYDRHFAELPRLYKAQRGMRRRLTPGTMRAS